MTNVTLRLEATTVYSEIYTIECLILLILLEYNVSKSMILTENKIYPSVFF